MFEGNFWGMKKLSFDIHTCDDRFAKEKKMGFKLGGKARASPGAAPSAEQN